MSLGGPRNKNAINSGLVDKFIGNAYKIVKDVQEHLSQIAYLADHLTELRPRNIEFRPNDTTQVIEWKYTDGDEWYLLVTYAQIADYSLEQIVAILGSIQELRQQTQDLRDETAELRAGFDENIINGQVLSLPNIITQDFTVAENYNALSIGPVAIADGVTVTVPEGSTYVVV